MPYLSLHLHPNALAQKDISIFTASTTLSSIVNLDTGIYRKAISH